MGVAWMEGQIGRPGTGLHPLRGQNNVQGASDAGLIPMMYPDYQRVDNPKSIERFSKAWNIPAEKLDRKSTRLNSSHQIISYAVFCLKKKKQQHTIHTPLWK